MTNLLKEDHELLHIPEEDKLGHPQAGQLVANIEAGHNMYKALQNSYSYYFTLYWVIVINHFVLHKTNSYIYNIFSLNLVSNHFKQPINI